ncbi:MAG: response regulator [Variibacter sp.]|nr:response regulator [Variibacter sp.]
MVHGLAAQSGGLMRISSAVGAGTTVELWFPAADEAAIPRPDMTAGVGEVVGTNVLQRACRVLVVDDDPLISSGTVAMLEDLGHTAVDVPSGHRALELLSPGHTFDLVITDHAMPVMTGIALAKEIHAAWPGLPVLLATGYADLPEGEATDLPRLSKPYRQEDLAAQIGMLLDHRPPSNVVPIEAARRS